VFARRWTTEDVYLKIYGKINDGMFSNMRELYRKFKLLEGERVTVSIAKQKAPRTIAQNNYLFGVVYPAIMDWMAKPIKTTCITRSKT
jgi:hypothetical protein